MNLITIFSTLLLIFSACSKESDPIIKNKQVNAISGERVDLVAFNAESYSWSQLSGIKVILINANTGTLSFIAPDVNETNTLVFEVQALMPSITDNTTIRKERATVTVYPLELVSDDNETTPTDINTTLPTDTNVTTPTDTNTTVPSDNNITTPTENNNTTLPTNPLKSIALTIANNSLNIDTNTTLNAIATYEDNSTKNVTDEVEWISSDLNAIKISKRHLKAKQEKNLILQAKLNNITSNAVALEIYQNINGHRLPPMPNKALNDSTLLGIDSNDNGVRDDVERKIYFTYNKKINQKLMMQSTKTYQAMLADPDLIKNAYDWQVPENKNLGCRSYLFRKHDIPLDSKYAKFINDNTYNSEERISKYMKYNNALSGGVFGTPESARVEASCDFNITKALGL